VFLLISFLAIKKKERVIAIINFFSRNFTYLRKLSNKTNKDIGRDLKNFLKKI